MPGNWRPPLLNLDIESVYGEKDTGLDAAEDTQSPHTNNVVKKIDVDT